MTSIVLAGLCTVDLIQRVADFPAPGGKAQAEAATVTAGGPAANAARTVTALGGRATLLTALGGHPLAGLIRAELAEVSIVDFAAPDFVPPVSAVTVRESDGERTIVSANATARDALPDAGRITAALAGADAVLLDGHHPALAVAVAAAAGDIPVVLDAGSWRPVFADLLRTADVCACSAGFAVPDGRTEPAFGPPVITRTHGAAPVRWWTGGAHGTVPVPPRSAGNTSGAGDVWHGALVHGIGELGRVPGGADLPALIRRANTVAGGHVGPPAG